jgi:hypothetical protein
MTSKNVQKLKCQFNHKDGKSQRKAAREFGVSQTYIFKLLKKCSIDCKKKQTIPDRNEEQAAVAKTKCRALTEKYRNRKWILDDESYFTLSHTSMNGNNFFYSSDVSGTPSNVKFARKAKLLLVWAAISRKGISRIFIALSDLSINQEIYGEECIRKRLILFIMEHHSQDEIIF